MKTNIKTAFSMVTVLVLVMFLSSFSSLSASNNNLLVGKWTAVTFEEYNKSGSLQSKETAQNQFWEISEQTITVRDKNDELNDIPLTYTLKDKTITLDKLSLTYTILELTDSKLVIQSSVLGDRYVIVTFKRAN